MCGHGTVLEQAVSFTMEGLQEGLHGSGNKNVSDKKCFWVVKYWKQWDNTYGGKYENVRKKVPEKDWPRYVLLAVCFGDRGDRSVELTERRRVMYVSVAFDGDMIRYMRGVICRHVFFL